jgi:SAM-dependent MidA family methyltransferase
MSDRAPSFHIDAFLTDAAPAHIAFRDYMDMCMFDPGYGYYAAGRVKFGTGSDEDYWTFPVRLSPFFGRMMARRVLEIWQGVRATVEANDATFHLVEVGGGMGHMLVDALDALSTGALAEAAKDLVPRLKILAVDRSPALLEQQGDRQSGLAVQHINAGAEDLAAVLPHPFYGVIMANELLTQMSVDVVRVGESDLGSLAVLPWLAAELWDLTTEGESPFEGLKPLAPGKFPALMARLAADEALLERFIKREVVRWSGVLAAPAPDTQRYLDFAAPVIARVRELGHTPTWVTFLPSLQRVVDALAKVFKEGAGAFITVDYGGTAQHVFDRASTLPHLRTFSLRYDDAAAALHDPFRAPGAEDMTTDLDFSWLVHLAQDAGLALGHYAHQAVIETGMDLWENDREALIQGRIDEGYNKYKAAQEAYYLVEELRGKGGFRFVALTTPDAAKALAVLGESDPVHIGELPFVPAEIDRKAFARAISDGLEAHGEQRWASEVPEAAAAIRAGGSVVDDLADRGFYRVRRSVLAALRKLS